MAVGSATITGEAACKMTAPGFACRMYHLPIPCCGLSQTESRPIRKPKPTATASYRFDRQKGSVEYQLAYVKKITYALMMKLSLQGCLQGLRIGKLRW
jgi:hypothetical protein